MSEISSFLGLGGYYRRFIEGFSNLAKPMIALLEKKAKSVWSEKCQANFEELKKILTIALVLVLLDLNKNSLSIVMISVRPRMCSYAKRKSYGICIKAVEEALDELSHS